MSLQKWSPGNPKATFQQPVKELALWSNKITVIPDSLARLTNLKQIELGGNQIRVIPDSLATLPNLRKLELQNNLITAIPSSFEQLGHLEEINFSGNPLPEELLAAASRGPESLVRYLQATRTLGANPRTVKLMLLGEPLSGKTTLLEALKGSPNPCDPHRQETIGVNVSTVAETHPGDGQPMYLAAWDFAGQHMEHATHQFFLTQSAIYLIVWKSRQGSDYGQHDLWYWLELLKMRVRDPEFLLVVTHTRATPSVLNLPEIQAAYPGCRGHFEVDLCDLTGVAQLKKRILELAMDSPSLRAAWPASWLAVRDKIREMRTERHYMTAGEFQVLCNGNAVAAVDQRDLADQLHKLGEIVFFQDREGLTQLLILNPSWLSEQVALVVRDREVRLRDGKLISGDLSRLWGALPQNVVHHLELLMDEFDLTYSTASAAGAGIVVEALPLAPEEVRNMDISDGRPQMERIFRFPTLQRHLPPGVPTWAFARAHRMMAKDQGPWRNAAVFEDSEINSRAIILASDLDREVRLRVAGDYPPYFFGRIEAILRDTFRRYPGAQPEQRIPCACRTGCTYSFLLETVMKRRKNGKPDISCELSGEDVPLDYLLSGFSPGTTSAGRLAFESEMRRRLTALQDGTNQAMVKTKCPSVFTLIPSTEFTLLDTWIEHATKDQELDLTLYCEYEKKWHPTQYGVYRFRPDQAWFDSLKKNWKQMTAFTKRVAPLAGVLGAPALGAVAASVGEVEKVLGDFSIDQTGAIASALDRKDDPGEIDLETRYLLERLIEYVDTLRGAAHPKNGGLFPYQSKEDGSFLWLCPEHRKQYERAN